MEILKYGITVLMVVFGVTLLYFIVTCKNGFKHYLLSAFLSICALFILNLTKNFTGVGLPINYYTVIGSGVLGFPAICLFLILKLIFI